MELGSTIFGLLALACFIVPVIYLQMKQKKKKAKFLAHFIGAAAKEKLIISAYDCWGHFSAIGIDKSQSSLFFLRKRSEEEQFNRINLAEVLSCQLVNENRTVNGSKTIDRLALKIRFKASNKAEQLLEFYNKEEGISLNEELKIAEKWHGLVLLHLQALTINSGADLKADPLAHV